MPISNNVPLTPEQKSKFYVNNNQANVSPNPQKRNIFPIVAGILGAALIAFLFYRFVIYKVPFTILSPFGGKDNAGGIFTPKVMNPITGEMVSESEALWKDERPIGVMVNNHIQARPQSGLYKADIVYEIVAEGGITRFLAFFLSNLPDKIGPVRSTREYYLVLVKELGDAMIMHIGWSPQALEAIETWPVRSLGRGGADFTRDQARIDRGIPIEHTAYVNGTDLRALGNKLGWGGVGDFVPWQFKEDGPVDKSQQCLVGECKFISIDFWAKGDYSGNFKYDRATNTYLRYSGYDEKDQPMQLLDQETKEPVRVKNLIIQFATETSIAGDEKNRLEYTLVGSGQSLVFMDGKVAKATWSKAGRDDRTKFFDLNGKEILFNRGKFWVSIVPDRNIEQVTY